MINANDILFYGYRKQFHYGENHKTLEHVLRIVIKCRYDFNNMTYIIFHPKYSAMCTSLFISEHACLETIGQIKEGYFIA